MKHIVTILFIFAIGFTTEAKSTAFFQETSIEESEDILSFVRKIHARYYYCYDKFENYSK